MPLKMSKQARIELLSVWREKYASVVSRYKKARIIDCIMQSAGYKNRKTVIRLKEAHLHLQLLQGSFQMSDIIDGAPHTWRDVLAAGHKDLDLFVSPFQ